MVRIHPGEQKVVSSMNSRSRYTQGVWRPFGASQFSMKALSNQDCPEGMICIGGVCVADKYKVLSDPAWKDPIKVGVSVLVDVGLNLSSGTKNLYENGQQERKAGPGLFEYLEEGNVFPYSPGESFEMKDYELTAEEHERFDSIEGATTEEIETAKKVLARTLRHKVSSIDSLAGYFGAMKYEPHAPENLIVPVGGTGLTLFNKYVKEEFENVNTRK